MLKIDAHHHLWKYSPREHAWIDDSMSVLKRDFSPSDLEQEMSKAGYSGCVAVQASQTEAETRYLLSEASINPFILGVVGWVNLSSPMIEQRLEYFSNFSDLKGIRHVLQDEKDDQFMLRDEFVNGIAALSKFDFCYDILIFPKHLKYAKELVKKFPNQKFVVDHIAKPLIKEGTIMPWAEDLKALASYENVSCKVSGMVTEADWKGWKKEDFTPYLDVVFESFGTDRLMIGSDWPVCKLAGDYDKVMNIVEDYLGNSNDKAKVLGQNALDFYGLTVPEVQP